MTDRGRCALFWTCIRRPSPGCSTAVATLRTLREEFLLTAFAGRHGGLDTAMSRIAVQRPTSDRRRDVRRLAAKNRYCRAIAAPGASGDTEKLGCRVGAEPDEETRR